MQRRKVEGWNAPLSSLVMSPCKIFRALFSGLGDSELSINIHYEQYSSSILNKYIKMNDDVCEDINLNVKTSKVFSAVFFNFKKKLRRPKIWGVKAQRIKQLCLIFTAPTDLQLQVRNWTERSGALKAFFMFLMTFDGTDQRIMLKC